MTKVERILEGGVVSDKADKTIVVSVSTRSKTRYKGKTIKRSQKYLVHDPDNSANEGDNVQITSSRPISKLKNIRIITNFKFIKGTCPSEFASIKHYNFF